MLALQPAIAQLLGLKTFKLQDDNKSFKINTLYKSRAGYIYCGSTNGLYQFDGLKFIKIPFSKAAARDTVTALFEDRSLQLWVGFKNGHIAKMIKGKLEFFEPDEGSPVVAITSFIQDKQNDIWFSTNGEGIYFFKNKHLYLIDSADGLSDGHVRTLALADNGDVLAATDQGINICTLNGTKKLITLIGPRDGLPDYYVTTITPAGNNTFLVGLQEKGYCLYDHKNRLVTLPAGTANWKGGQVNALLAVQNSVWIASEENGLLLQKGFNDPLSIPAIETGNQKIIHCLLTDNEGNIWMSSSTELICTGGDKLKLYPLYDKNLFESIHSILADHQNAYWIGTLGGVLKYEENTRMSFQHKMFRIAELNSKTAITSLYEDTFHHIWIGTMGKGIFILDPGTGAYRNLTENPLLQNASILSITGKGNTICAGGLEGVAMIFELNEMNKTIASKTTFTNYKNIANISNTYIYQVFINRSGKIFFGTDGKGLTVMENGRFINYNHKDGLKDDIILSFTEDKLGNTWFCTENAGIYKFDGQRFKNYTIANGLSDLKITTIKTDRQGNIIIVHIKGVDILDPSTGAIAYLDNKQGLGDINPDNGGVSIDTAGNILLSTENGIVVYSPSEKTTIQPTTIIDRVQLFQNNVDEHIRGKFSYNQNSLSFYFTGIYYTDPEQVQYQYKLEGLDTAWVLTRDRSIPFPGLQPGSYTFHVRSSLSDNFESALEASYKFVIEPPFWKRLWFIILCILVGAALMLWYMKAREKHLKRMQQLKHDKVRFQFEVLRNQVNPHFLFNSFNTLISTIEENPALAVGYVEQLSDFFRNIVNYRDKNVITLGEEIFVLKTYFYLQQKRYGNYLQLNIHISEEEKNQNFIPPLTLQLLMENAIKHNVVSKEAPLLVDLFMENGKRLILRNNINSKISKEAGAGMGLQNIINRYNLLSGETVLVTKDNNFFTVSLPTLQKDI